MGQFIQLLSSELPAFNELWGFCCCCCCCLKWEGTKIIFNVILRALFPANKISSLSFFSLVSNFSLVFRCEVVALRNQVQKHKASLKYWASFWQMSFVLHRTVHSHPSLSLINSDRWLAAAQRIFFQNITKPVSTHIQ